MSGEGDDFISTWEEVHDTFDAMGLHENLLRGIYAYGEQHYTLSVDFLFSPSFVFLIGRRVNLFRLDSMQ